MTRAALVLDASALIAYLARETGFEVVEDAFRQPTAISSVNLAEVLGKLAEFGREPGATLGEWKAAGFIGEIIQVHLFSEAMALETARLRSATRNLGLSLGDRACLALAAWLAVPVLTTDKRWTQLDLGVEIRLIR
ncbi:MAG: PIN domain-containing protein [Acidobacteria bacterium]|nr:PIN domain-containing protein [Acidobacteriota bacterium]